MCAKIANWLFLTSNSTSLLTSLYFSKIAEGRFVKFVSILLLVEFRLAYKSMLINFMTDSIALICLFLTLCFKNLAPSQIKYLFLSLIT